MRILARLALTLLLSATCVAATEKSFDAAARAKAIAPFVDERTFAVAHVDMSRIALDPLVAKAMEMFPDRKADLAAGKADLAAMQEQFLRAGARDAYVVFNLAFAMSREPLFWVIPLGPGVDEKAVLASLPAQRPWHARLHGALVLARFEETHERIRGLKPEPRPELAAVFEAAGDTAVQVLLIPPRYARRVIEETMPVLPKEIGGGPSSVLTRGASWAAIGIDLPPQLSLRLTVQSQDAQSARALQVKIADVLRHMGGSKQIRNAVPNFERVAALVVPKVAGDRLLLDLTDTDRAFTDVSTTWTPLVARATEEARRGQSVNNLKHIALAMHSYHDVHKCFPPPATYSPDGKPLLSWRVLILPYLEQEQLYQQFRLNEPWDSPHNRALIGKMPAIYRCPGSKRGAKERTNYVVPVAPQTVFFGRQGTSYKDITDGVSNTIMVVECDDEHASLWTKPDDLPFDPKNPSRGLGLFFGPGRFHVAFCDGSVRLLPATISADTLRALFTKAGGEVVGKY